MDKIKETKIEDEIRLSYDVTAIFTLIDLKLEKKAVQQFFQKHHPDTALETSTIGLMGTLMSKQKERL